MRKLQKQLKYLEGTNRMQDETIKDLTEKVEKLQNFNTETDTALYHLKNVLKSVCLTLFFSLLHYINNKKKGMKI